MRIPYQQIIEYCKVKSPQEACGVIVVNEDEYIFLPCANIADNPLEHFEISTEEYAQIEDQYPIIAIVHSHPREPLTPSDDDVYNQSLVEIPYLVMGMDTSPIATWVGERPKEEHPLNGRVFIWNIYDCFTFVRDWYRDILQIDIPQFEYKKDFWLENKQLYLENYASAGFVEVPLQEIKYGDAILFDLAEGITSHAAIYVGNNKIAHHLAGRLSGEETLNRFFLSRITKVVRHRSMF